MKPLVIDVNFILDLINLRAIDWLFKSGFQVYTTREVIDHLNEHQYDLLKNFIDSGQLSVYHLCEKELEEAIVMTAEKKLAIADKSAAWLSVYLSGFLISDIPFSLFYRESKHPEIQNLTWFFDVLIENQIITHTIAIQKIKELVKVNRKTPREQYENKIKEWEVALTSAIIS